jgi:hypothetical protein
MARQKMFICNRTNPLTGKVCGKECSRRWNLDRHIKEHHKALKFINYVPSVNGLQRLPSDSEGEGELDEDADEDEELDLDLDVGDTNSGDAPQPIGPQSQPTASAPGRSPSQQLPTTQPSDLPPSAGELAQENTTSTSTSTSNADLTPPWLQRKNRRCRDLCGSADKEDLPTYQVKRSKKTGAQQLAIQWLTQVAKNHFDKYLAAALAQWGVKPSHTGTCVLLPADWAALDPSTIADLFSTQSCPHEYEDQELVRPPTACIHLHSPC